MTSSFLVGQSSNQRLGRHVTISEWERAVVLTDGVHTETAGPGRYRRRRRTEWLLVDVRPRLLGIPAQEVLTKDGVQVRLSVIATLGITDAAVWTLASSSPYDLIYSAVQVALRDRVADTDLMDLSSSRSTLLDGVEAELAPAAAALGATVTAIAIKDITLPQEVRAAVAQAALAKQRGLAELERTRSEAASLRSLANSAKLMAENPMLLQLRTLQAASEGAQIIIHRESGAPEDAAR